MKVIGLAQAAITQILHGEMNVIDAKSQKPVVLQEGHQVATAVARTVDQVVRGQIVVAVLIETEIKDQCEAMEIEMTEIGHIKNERMFFQIDKAKKKMKKKWRMVRKIIR